MSLKNTFTKLGLIEDTLPQVPTKKSTPVSKKEVEVVEPTYTPESSDTVDSAISQMLQQSFEENKLSGFDYLKFMSAVEEMKSYGTPEETRYKMAFSTAKQVGASKAGLTKAAQHYLDVLDQDEKDFDNDCSQYEKKEIQGRTTKIAELETQVSTLADQLAKAKDQHEKLSGELEEKKSGLESRKASFQTTLKSFTSTIQANLEKINKYL